jgi:hypothetical protein
MTIFLDFLISLIFGYFLFLLVNYLTFKLNITQSKSLYTNDISTNIITFTENYQEILSIRLNNDSGFFVTIDEAFRLFLTHQWGIYDIKTWLESLGQRDYAVTIEFIAYNSDISLTNRPRIILSKEFMVNKDSDPLLISNFLIDQLNVLYNLFDIENNENHIILIHYVSLNASY